VADDRRAAGVRLADGVEQRRRGNPVEELPRGDRHDVGPGQPLQAVLHGDRDPGVGAQHARRLGHQGEVEARQAHVAPVVAEHLGADAEPEAAHEAVGHDDADHQRTVLLCHDVTMAEKVW
jgi:hypothetical protein